jgi:DNA-binding LytR/AlgR family response regulator
MIRILIADDEALQAASLAQRLQALWPDITLLPLVHNGIDAVAALAREQPDIAFLDIRMPGLSGLQVAAAAARSRVVFVTAYDEYALAAFDASAVDYLLKPVSDARLAQCVTRLQRDTRPAPDLAAVLAQLAAPAARAWLQWLHAGLGDTTRLIAVDEVLYFQSSDKYTEIVTAHERHLIRLPLKELLAQLDPQRFAQIHRSYIVSLSQVGRIERDLLGRQQVILKDGHSLPLSRSHAAQFRQM